MKHARSEITFLIDLYFEKAHEFEKSGRYQAVDKLLKLDLRAKNSSENDLCSSYKCQSFQRSERSECTQCLDY